jgi:hypothetical protein
MADNKSKFVSDDGISTVPHPVTPEGGVDKKRPADKKKAVAEPKAVAKESTEVEDTETVVEEVVEVENSIASIFEGTDLSEEFKSKVQLVFEAAVNEEVSKKVQVIESELTEKLEAELQESLETKVTEIVENLDKYLDYVVNEWMEENKVAIEAGIKVEMAESLMNGLKELFSEHNIEVDDETLNIVSGLEEQISELETKANDLVNENISLVEDITSLKAGKVFEEMTEDLTLTQRERLKVLSEKLDFSNLEVYTENLQTLKESFFTESIPVQNDNVVVEEDEIVLEEQVAKKPVSDYSSINALVEALNARKSK